MGVPGVVRSVPPRLVPGLVLLAALWSPAGSRAAQTSVNVSTNYYFFTGTNRAGIRAAMIQSRPWKQSSAYDAHTDWQMRCSLTWRRAGGQYVIDTFQVKTKVALTLPGWIPAPPVDSELVSQWQEFFKGLSRHEQGHVQLARDATAELERRLSAIGGYDSAQELTVAADRAAKEITDEFRKKDHSYDQETRHGVTQGAIFGPGPPAAR
jgi:predicted secreted Zn-dependent protease